jgi:hypothetical protein
MTVYGLLRTLTLRVLVSTMDFSVLNTLSSAPNTDYSVLDA